MHRHIRQLRLTCAQEDDARHGRVLLEDAMRTASLGDETRFILVRRLDLGRLPPRATATQWSRRLEESFRETHPVAVRFDSPAAAEAGAVFFSNRHEPWIVLAERMAARQACPEWFWRIATPAWRPSHSAEQALRLCFRALADLGGLALTLALALRLKARGALPDLLRCLQREDFAALKAELEALAPPATSTTASAADPAAASDSKPQTPGALAAAAFATSWSATDLRTRWLAAVAVANAPGLVEPRFTPPPTPGLPAVVQQVVLKWTEKNPPAPADDRVFTRAGGLFFVLPLLARAGFPSYLKTLSPGDRAALPWQLLRVLLRHARTPANDPLVLALESIPVARERLGPWLLAANRHARRLTRLSLRQLIGRPALVALTATHIDVFFRPTETNLQIRRAALDVDPGWVPWLGRVVAFHFNRED